MLTQFYGFFKVTFAGKACPVISHSLVLINSVMHQQLNSMAFTDVKCLFFIIVYPFIPVAGFEAILE